MKENVTRGNGLMEGYLARRRAEIANSFIHRSLRKGKILDIGCGSHPYFLINTLFKKKYGLDQIDKLQVDENVKIINQDIEEKTTLPFEDNFFDCITALAVIEHIKIEKIDVFLTEIMRILKPEGRIIITTPTPFANHLLKIMAVVGLVSKEEIHEHEKIFTGLKLKKALQKAGFRRRKIKTGLFEFFLNNWAFADK